MKLERTKNSIRNMAWGIANRLVNIIVPFVLRTVFTYSLGVSYLGLNSLFTSILTVLNLAELGFSSAIVYNMYKPIAENDTDMICSLMSYYRKVYRIIGCIVVVIGLLCIPFLQYLINGEIPPDINLVTLYMLYLGNTAVSYFLFAYKNCILTAYQREDIISKISIVLRLAMYAVQSIFLMVFKSYYGYVICSIVNTILTNVVTAYYSNKFYPEYSCKGVISRESKKKIKKNIEGLMVGKLCMVSRNAFDNIFLSAFLGLNIVTIYGNYYYIMNAISGILTILMASIGAGIGNSIATESVEKNYLDFKKFTFMYSWISGWCAVCLFCLYQSFMILWMGQNMLLPLIDVILICIYFYSLTMGDVRSQYSTGAGLFWESRKYVVVEAVCNIILNYLLGKRFGVHGIILATWISIFFINFVWGSRIVFKHYFKTYRICEYYKTHMIYFLNVIVATIITWCLAKGISGTGWATLAVKSIVCLFVPNLYFYAVYRKKMEFVESIDFVKRNVLSQIKVLYNVNVTRSKSK